MLSKFRKFLKPVAKAMTWRVFASAEAFLVAWLVTGHIEAAASVVGIGMVTHTAMFMIHDALWSRFG